MTEVDGGFPHEASFDDPVSHDTSGPPLLDEQDEFFRSALLEAEEKADQTRYLRGPLHGAFEFIAQKVQNELTAIDPRLTPEHLLPAAFQSPDVHRSLEEELWAVKPLLKNVRLFRNNESNKLAQESLATRLSEQGIPQGLLDTPPYCKQDESNDNYTSSGSMCANACFRMIFGGITGWVPSEETVAQHFIESKGKTIVSDSEYNKLLTTDLVGNTSGKVTSVIDIVGADFATIDRLASVIRRGRPAAKIYAVVNITSTESPLAIEYGVWHTSVLLGTTDTDVICHDPSVKDGGPYKSIPRNTFAQRWAGTMNRVQLFIAD